MKRLFRIVCAVFAAAALSMGVTAAAANDDCNKDNDPAVVIAEEVIKAAHH